MNPTRYQIVLGSNSPRRKELLSGIDVNYHLRAPQDVDETYSEDLPYDEIPEYLAKKKALAGLKSLTDGELLITADTIVVLEGDVLEKPQNKKEVCNMLRRLSNKTHQVITGVCLTSKEKQVCFSDITRVTFEELTDEEINYYSNNYNPTDKAGSYGVQEWIGYIGVKHLEGSYFNVMGLPINRLYQAITRF